MACPVYHFSIRPPLAEGLSWMSRTSSISNTVLLSPVLASHFYNQVVPPPPPLSRSRLDVLTVLPTGAVSACAVPGGLGFWKGMLFSIIYASCGCCWMASRKQSIIVELGRLSCEAYCTAEQYGRVVMCEYVARRYRVCARVAKCRWFCPRRAT